MISTTVFSVSFALHRLSFVLIAPAIWWVVIVLLSNATPSACEAQQPEPIWSQQTMSAAKGMSAGECCFRKKFTLAQPEKAELEIFSGGDIELYINDRLAHRSVANTSSISLDLSSYFKSGVNLFAIKVRHAASLPVGFSAKLRVKELSESRWRVLTTNETWNVNPSVPVNWNKLDLNDSGWSLARVVKPSQSVAHALSSNSARKETDANAVQKTPAVATEEDPRFSIDPEFRIDEILSPDETGSLIALEFNEFGRLLLSREGGPLMIADINKRVGDPDRIRVYCDQVNTCQGILPLNGSVYVTGMGPQGLGLYRLSDNRRTGTIDEVKKILGFTGGPGEHGPHGIQLGPDGMLYVILGNGTQLQDSVAPTSPYRNWYEGDLVPRYEDPGGHAVGVKAPGGTIVRMSLDGSRIERFAGGIRNAYDLVFDDQGELIVHDSDMESDVGSPWYRPNQIFFVAAGAELGWRSGWSNFPNHAIDQTPPLCNTGRGSPTGAVLYQHIHFPARFHDTVFLADWSEGKILILNKEPFGAGYRASTEVFLSGKPLNVCDLAVGEDGGLYFCTGGRGTSGGVYRVSWTGTVPKAMLEYESDLAKVIRHPQPDSAWGRQNLAQLCNQMGAKWDSSLEGVAKETRNPTKFRVRALQFLTLYGSGPSIELLTELADAKDAHVRAEVARICGLKDREESRRLLDRLIADSVPRVRRMAGEAYLRFSQIPRFSSLKSMLSSEDRFESAIARRLLERIPANEWETEVFRPGSNRLFINSAISLLTADPSLDRSYKVLARCSEIFESYVSDLDFLDLLRVTQLALVQGGVEPAKVPGLVDRIGSEFPSGNSIVNRELARIMALLKIGEVEGRVETYLKSGDILLNDRIHVAMYLQFVGRELPDSTRLAIIDLLETSRTSELSAGLKLYIKRAIEDAAKTLSPSQLELVLANGERWPNAVISVFYQLPEKLSPSTMEKVLALDQTLIARRDPVSEQLRLGVIAILARDGGQEAMDYLRTLWIDEPLRRKDIVMGLAEQPAGENWPYLVSSLSGLDDLTGREIVTKLTGVNRRPIEPQFFRDLIQLGYRMRNAGASEAVQLLEIWTGESPPYPGVDWISQITTWKDWYHMQFPDETPITLEHPKVVGKHSLGSLISFTETKGKGSAAVGKELFVSAQCSACHRHGSIGENLGPDLTNLAQRFSLREVLEATIDPSATIPDRYRSKIILTKDGDLHAGMAIEQASGEYLILRSDGKRIRVLPEDIEEIKDSEVSAMPEGLLDPLNERQIADLMAFLLDQGEQTAGSSSNPLR
jgi:putative heme-binding domain-containing protein